ncbi:MAG: tetratricopeptide repeat protein [Armatimonadetes bacterium]|nr:tetratricopeptide repeat protein [Armatimonadota bacterium]MDW8121555.1 tetratricopeptide repeat protein [Armatimonadota bacterium]
MERERRLDTLHKLLKRLAEKVGEKEFVIRYFQVILNYWREAPIDSESVTDAIESVLRYELWHHGALRRLAEKPDLQGRYLIPMGVEMRTALLALTARLEKLSVFHLAEKGVVSLLLAHCHYQLGSTPAVISALEDAVAAGVTDSLVYFALGFNRHRLALSQYARWEAFGRRLVVLDREGFETQLRRAIEDFKAGLSPSGSLPSDAPFYMWIGLIQEMLGETQEALASYEQARRLDPDAFSGEATGHIERIRRASDRPAEKEKETAQGSPPALPRPFVPESEPRSPVSAITEADLERLRKAIGEVSTMADFLKRLGEEESGPEN